MNNAVEIDGLWKLFRRYHEKNQYLKSAILRGGRARYEEFWALEDVSLKIAHGETFGIIGRNGSGKSTLLKCLSGILTPDRGSLKVDGRLVPLLELGAGFHPELSGRENVFLNSAILGMSRSETQTKYDEIVEFADIGKFIDSPIKNYSSGMVVRLGFAIAISVNPEILIVDEVLSVGDTIFQQKCREKIETMRRQGVTIILVSHSLGEIERICHDAMWLDSGRVKMLDSAPKVIDAYTTMSREHRLQSAFREQHTEADGSITISDVAITNRKNQPVDFVTCGEQLNIEINYYSNIDLDSCSISVRITELHGAIIWETITSLQNLTLPIRQNVGSFRLRLDRLPLLQGTYEISVSINDISNSFEYSTWDKRTRFDVKQTKNHEQGLVHIDATWD